jgi:uncharacterized phage protein (TIGR01671 family)
MIPRFRAWDKELQTMLDVSLIDFKKRVLVGEHWKFGETNFMSFDDIKRMQSTGLFDKNGKEIFEGDILKSNKYITSVFYERGAYRVKLRRTPNTTVTMDLMVFIEKYKTRIVGNIYENPELLEVKE